jgi:CheY-like chemotaxis protein
VTADDHARRPDLVRNESGGVALPHVLLVDDDADMAGLLRLLVKRRGFTVTLAGSVGAALAVASTTPIDMLVSDIVLPDGTGYDLLARLRAPLGDGGIVRAPGSVRSLPAIAMSGLDRDSDVKRTAAAGFDEYLGKPVSVDALVDALRRVFGD